VAFAAFCLMSGGWTGVVAAVGLDLLPARNRSTGAAVYFLVTTLFGAGLGAFAVGWLSDALGSLGQALAWSCLVLIPAAGGLIGLAASLNPASTRKAPLGP
jgi:hypothetical protein